MDRESADRLVRAAIERLIAEQPELLSLDVSERSLTHHLANYIAASVGDGLNVDIEYNRHHSDPKRLKLSHRRSTDHELRATTVFPDIVVHQRDSDRRNMIVLEVKKLGESLEYDQLKLEGFRDQLGYENAGHVVVGAASAGNPVFELTWLEGVHSGRPLRYT